MSSAAFPNAKILRPQSMQKHEIMTAMNHLEGKKNWQKKKKTEERAELHSKPQTLNLVG
jgi:hypothetical protein